jgi:hypothetical protein
VRRGAASCRAVLSSCSVAAAVRVALAGVVTAEPSWVAERRRRCNPSEAWSPNERSPWPWRSRLSGRRPCRWSPRPGPLSTVRCPVSGVRCPGVRCGRGVRPTRVRCPRPVHCAVRTAVGPGVRRCGGQPLAHRLGRVAVGPWAAWSSARVGPGGKGMALGWHQVDGGPAGSSDAHRLRRRARRLVDQGSWSSSRVPAGWLGSTTWSRCSQFPRRYFRGRLPAWTSHHRAEPGGDGYAPWSLCWCRAASPSSGRAIGVRWGGDRGRSAAAIGDERCPPGLIAL